MVYWPSGAFIVPSEAVHAKARILESFWAVRFALADVDRALAEFRTVRDAVLIQEGKGEKGAP